MVQAKDSRYSLFVPTLDARTKNLRYRWKQKHAKSSVQMKTKTRNSTNRCVIDIWKMLSCFQSCWRATRQTSLRTDNLREIIPIIHKKHIKLVILLKFKVAMFSYFVRKCKPNRVLSLEGGNQQKSFLVQTSTNFNLE